MEIVGKANITSDTFVLGCSLPGTFGLSDSRQKYLPFWRSCFPMIDDIDKPESVATGSRKPRKMMAVYTSEFLHMA